MYPGIAILCYHRDSVPFFSASHFFLNLKHLYVGSHASFIGETESTLFLFTVMIRANPNDIRHALLKDC